MESLQLSCAVVIVPLGTNCVIKLSEERRFGHTERKTILQIEQTTGETDPRKFFRSFPVTEHRLKVRAQSQKNHERFRAAIAYARDIINDPLKKIAYAKNLSKGQSVYREAMKEFLKQHRPG
jgi:hypothetical protein